MCALGDVLPKWLPIIEAEAVLLPRHIDANRSPDGRQVRAQAVKHCRHLSPIKLSVPCIARLPRLPPQHAIRDRGSHWRRPKLRERLRSPPAPAWGFRDSDATAYPRRLFVIIVIIHHAVRPQLTVHTSLTYHINHSRDFATCAVARTSGPNNTHHSIRLLRLVFSTSYAAMVQ